MPVIACQHKITCECSDDPVRNLSAEDPDLDRHIGVFNLIITTDLQVAYQAFACKTYCYSDVSQDEADDCARRLALECIAADPPPPGTPNPLTLFYNSAQSYTVHCPDGTPFTWTIPAGAFIGLNQFGVNQIALSVAKNRAIANRICIVSNTLNGGCVGSDFTVTIEAVGGNSLFFPYIPTPQTPFGFGICGQNFQPINYVWSVVGGSLPPGLELDECTGQITGTPTATGVYAFTVRVTDAIGSYQQKSLSICIIRITTASPLPDATEGQSYSQNLSESGGDQETETWSVVSGSLPAGMTLTPAGVLSGTPEETGDFSFRIRVSVETCT
jgi:Putative Ig domain